MKLKTVTIPRGLVRLAPVGIGTAVGLPPRFPRGDKHNLLRLLAVAEHFKAMVGGRKRMSRMQRRRWLALLEELRRDTTKRRPRGRPRSEKRSADDGR